MQTSPSPTRGRVPFFTAVCLRWRQYLLAIIAIAAAAAVRSQLLEFLGVRLPYVTFLPAVLAVFLYAGVSAGLLSAFLSICYVTYILDSSPGQILIIRDSTDKLVASFSLMTCIVILLAVRTLRRVQRRAREAEHQARLAEERSIAEASLREIQLQHQEAILAVNAGLEQRVRERTAELEAAIGELEAFSYSVSHDLRAPLRHINSFSAILLEEYAKDLPSEAANYLDRIKGATRNMGAMIDHLLEFSRLSRAELTREWVDLSQLVAGITTMLRETEPQRRVDVCVQDGVRVRGDRELLRQLLENLLGNAWKYSSVQPLARIEFGQSRVDGQEAFFVRDNGVGFDMAYSGRLFEVFQRLHGAQFEGTGIGMATAQRIVQRHGGAIWANSRVGEGATFYFTIPASHMAEQHSSGMVPPSSCQNG